MTNFMRYHNINIAVVTKSPCTTSWCYLVDFRIILEVAVVSRSSDLFHTPMILNRFKHLSSKWQSKF